MKNNIKTARENKNFTQKECADTIGVTLRAWQTYEQGVSEPKQETLCKIADMFNVSLDYLLGREPLPDPFDDLNLSEDNEKEVMKKYMSLSPSVRAVLLDVLIQLAEAAKGEQEQKQLLHNGIQQSTGRMMTEKIIAFGGDNEENEISEDEMIERFKAIKERKRREREGKKME